MKISFTIILVLLNLIINAQNPVHRVLDNLTGLASNTVYNILQDKLGFMWIAHDKGLSRYDGKQVVNYKNNSQQSKSLSNLLEHEGSIYCQDFSGNFYKTKNNLELEKINFNTPGPFSSAGIVNNKLVSIKYDSLRVYDIKSNTCYSKATNAVNTTIYFANANEAYLGVKNRFFSFDGINSEPLITFDSSFKFVYFIKIKNNFYGITKNTYPYIQKLNSVYNSPNTLIPKGSFIQDICVLNNEIWICTSTGAYCFNEDFSAKYNGNCFFRNSSISKVIIDKEGNYWFSSLNNGVLIVPNIHSKLYSYNSESFTTLCNNSNNILLGTNSNSIVNFNTETKTFTPLLKLPNNHEVLQLFLDNSNNLFTSSNSLNVVQKNTIINYNIASKSITQISNNLYAMAYASDVGIINGKKNISLVEIPKWLKTINGKIENNIYKLYSNKGRCRDVLYHSPTKTLYIATATGIFFYDNEKSGEIKFNNQSIFASQFTSNNNQVFVGTFAQSVFSINKNKKVEQLAITKNAIYKIHNYNNLLFLVADDGLIEFNLNNNSKRIFTYADGLPKAEVKDVIIKDNIAYVVTSNGLVNIDINTKKINKTPPPVIINDIIVNGEIIKWINNIELPTNKNNISINFSVLSYKSQEAISVKYKINDNEWQNLEPNFRVINLPALSSGKYNITIKAINEDGIETIKPKLINFSIKTPIYKQLWFIAVLMLMICFIGYLYFKRRLKVQAEQNKLLSQKISLEKELQQSMLASIKSQMNPHFLFNALNTIQSYIYTNEKENATSYLGKFSELTRMILEMSNKPSVTIAKEIKALQLYLDLEKQRFEDKLNYSFTCDKNINTETSYIPSMLIQPYVENAIKHGLLHSKRNWELTIDFKKSSNGITVIIDDNGIGRKRSAELNKHKHQGFSTNANKKRLDILNEDLNNEIAIEIIDKTDAFGNALGTLITFNIPFVFGST